MKGHEFADFLISHKFPALIDKHFSPFFFHRSNPNQVTFVSCTSIRPIPLHFKARGTSMDRCLEHQSPQFAVDSQFESFASLKHACTRAALLDVYEFVPDKVDTDRQCSQFFNRLFGYSRINESNMRWIRIRFFPYS